MLHFSFCNHLHNPERGINVKAPVSKYKHYVMQVDKAIVRVYGLPTLSEGGLESQESNEDRHNQARLYRLALALTEYDDVDLSKDLEGVNLLPVDYKNQDYEDICRQYFALFNLMLQVAKRSSVSMQEWSKLLNQTWYQVHLIHGLTVEGIPDTENILRIVEGMITALDQPKPRFEKRLTPEGKRYLKEITHKLRYLQRLLSEDIRKHGVLKSSLKRNRSHGQKQQRRGWSTWYWNDWEEEFSRNMHREWQKIRQEQQQWAGRRRNEWHRYQYDFPFGSNDFPFGSNDWTQSTEPQWEETSTRNESLEFLGKLSLALSVFFTTFYLVRYVKKRFLTKKTNKPLSKNITEKVDETSGRKHIYLLIILTVAFLLLSMTKRYDR